MQIFKEPLEKRLQKRTAYLSISRSALRNQGAKGLVKVSREFAAEVNLKIMAEKWNKKRYSPYLDQMTELLMRRYPKDARTNFGAARKALNLFFRDTVYNRVFTTAFGLSTSKSHLSQLELPLDSYTIKGLAKSFPELKREWSGIKYLKPGLSEIFQQKAAQIAARNGLVRVELDVFYWNIDKF